MTISPIRIRLKAWHLILQTAEWALGSGSRGVTLARQTLPSAAHISRHWISKAGRLRPERITLLFKRLAPWPAHKHSMMCANRRSFAATGIAVSCSHLLKTIGDGGPAFGAIEHDSEQHHD
jgi:hypothetical protein